MATRTTAKKTTAKKSGSAVRMSDEAVRAKTGRGLDEWFALLDAAGAAKLPHADIARLLRDQHGVSMWWSQSVTVQYERARGLRVVGQQSSGTWQTSAQKTLPATRAAVWAELVRPASIAGWLGTRPFDVEEGAPFALTDGLAGEVRTVRPEELLRLAWRTEDGKRTLEVYVNETGPGRTALRFLHSGLTSDEERVESARRWRGALDELAGRFGK